jgi:hypothetical protein
MGEQSDLVRRQLELAAHIRDPRRHARPADIEDRRMAIYRDLFYNNVESLLAGNFPVLRKILADEHWHGMVRDFYARHRCETPLFLEIGQELLVYLQDERGTEPGDPPFMLELAHYEWVELALAISDDEPDLASVEPDGDLMSGPPVISPLAWNLSYRFPVHRLSPDYQPAHPPSEPTHLVVYRNRADDVEFMEVNAVTQRFLQLLRENPDWTGRRTVKSIAEELRHPQPDLVFETGSRLLHDLRKRDIVLGTRRADRARSGDLCRRPPETPRRDQPG